MLAVGVQGVNLAANAFLRWSLGPQYNARLLALMEMPKQATAPEPGFQLAAGAHLLLLAGSAATATAAGHSGL